LGDGDDAGDRGVTEIDCHGLEIDLRPLPGEQQADPDYYRTATKAIDATIARLQEGVADGSITHVSTFAFDVCLTLGYGFPRHEGGPLWWAAHRPADTAARALDRLATATGHGFRPAPVREILAQTRTA
jgi:3-hydroxyacyl-CoA dehydrogenase